MVYLSHRNQAGEHVSIYADIDGGCVRGCAARFDGRVAYVGNVFWPGLRFPIFPALLTTLAETTTTTTKHTHTHTGTHNTQTNTSTSTNTHNHTPTPHALLSVYGTTHVCRVLIGHTHPPNHPLTHPPTHPPSHSPTLPLTHPLVIQCCAHFTDNRACSLRPGKRSSGRQSRQASRCGADCWPSRSQLQLWVAVHRSFAGSFRLNPAVLRVQSVYFIKKPQRVSIRKEYSSECVRGGMRG